MTKRRCAVRAVRAVPLLVALQLAHAGKSAAQTNAALPPVRTLGAPIAVSRDTIRLLWGTVRQLSDGRVMINDLGNRRVFLLDSMLSHPVVVADSTAATNARRTAARTARSSPTGGDTTIFVDPRAVALLFIDPHGAVVRTVATATPERRGQSRALVWQPGHRRQGPARVPRSPGAMLGGRLVRNWAHGPATGQRAALERSPAGQSTTRPPSCAAISRRTSSTRSRSSPLPSCRTRSAARTPTDGSRWRWGIRFRCTTTPSSSRTGRSQFSARKTSHIDWINADGSRTSSPRIAHDWHRMSDSEKTRTVDSMHTFIDSMGRLVRARAHTTTPSPACTAKPEATTPKILWQVLRGVGSPRLYASPWTNRR